MDDKWLSNLFGFKNNNNNNNNKKNNDDFKPSNDDDFNANIIKMFENIDKMMQHFYFESPNQHQLPPPQQREHKELRDEFLKPQFNNNEEQQLQQQQQQQPKSLFSSIFQQHPLFRFDVFKYNGDNFFKIEDELFEKSIFFKQEQVEPMFQQSSQTFRRIQRPNGTIEEIKTIHNSNGNEEKIITRIIGDQKHTERVKTNLKTKETETEQIFDNLDENEMAEFNQKWNGNILNEKQKEKDKDKQLTTNSLFKKIFSLFK
jgi:hypothetical protein